MANKVVTTSEVPMSQLEQEVISWGYEVTHAADGLLPDPLDTVRLLVDNYYYNGQDLTLTDAEVDHLANTIRKEFNING